MKQHKWHKEIKAWADGAEIEWKRPDGQWETKRHYFWDVDIEYRIKPQPLPSTEELIKTYTDAIIDVVCNGKLASQPKEPQYLYVYARNGEVNYIYDEPRGWAEDFVGKIKLETDDVGAT